jgi:hypothetical protein
MHSSHVVAGISIFCYPEKRLDTSGKSGVRLDHPAIRKAPIALLRSRRFGMIAGNPSHN